MRPACCADTRSRAACSCWWCPGSQQVKAAAEAEGLDRVFIDAGGEWRESGCSMCIGMNGDNVGARPGIGQHQQPQFRGPPGPRRAHAAGQPADRRGQRGARPRHRSARTAQRLGLERPTEHGTHPPIPLAHRRPAGDQHRHRPDHPGPLPAHHGARGSGQAAVRRLALHGRWRAARGFSAQPTGRRGLPDSRGRTQLRLRFLARTRALGAARLRLPRRDQHRDRRYLPQQLAEERAAADRRRTRPTPPGCWRIRASNCKSTSKAIASCCPTAARSPFQIERFARYCLLNGVDELGYLRSQQAAIARFEAAHREQPRA